MGSRAAREASSIQWKYHIFLSFSGKDTRNGFTSHLHKALESRGYDVFMDEYDLQVGQVIKPELLQAIEKSKISVIVFSESYADSSWCLNELVKIMECRRTLNQIVLPIFYNVDPTHFRKQTGPLASQFQKHTDDQHKDELIKEWRKALTEAANLCGKHLKDSNEPKFIEEFIENNIVGRLSTTPLPVAAYPVGVDSRVHDMISYLLGGGSQDDVVMIGIWGMGGLGKTTAAKAIYNRIKDKFEAHGFLGDIRDTANRHGLVYLQNLLLAEINKKPTKFHISCVDGGMGMIKKELGRKRVLVIIDDVDKKEQLEAIVGDRDWFGSGSRIIITTRDEHFLDVLHVNKTFTVPEMNPDEGLELFCRHAFEKGCPNKQYLELSKMVVSYSGGLPLALKVLGSFLIRRSIAEWKSQLKGLERILPTDINKKLKISYDGLDHEEKCIFLDISCFFIGMNKDHVRKILDGCGFTAEIKISVLLQKCLVTVNEENQLTMHDLLRDMGRAICQEGDPEDRSRLWLSPEDLTDVLEDKSGTKKVERLALNLRSSEKASFGTEAFSEMRKLKLLQLNYAELTGEYKLFLSKNLRWLCWHGFLLDSIPGDFDLRSLVAMDLQFSKLKIVWKDCKLLEKLKIINLSHSHDLTTSPDFSKVPNLEELILECTSLSHVHESVGDLKRLALVNLEHCRMLKDLPLNLYRSKSIETLLLNGCSIFENLAEGLGDMISLRTLEADDTAITKIPSSIVKLKNLRSLALCGLELLTGPLPHSYLRSTGFLPPLLDGLNSLRKLALANRSLTDDELPKDLGSLSSLEHLDCGQNSFCRLPSLGGLSKLEYLCLNDCRKLRAIPELPKNLKVLRGFGCTALKRMPDFSEMSSIRELYFSDSYKLTEIPGLDKSLNSLTKIHMEGCTNLTPIFREKILQGWTSCGFGGIHLAGIYGIPRWFKWVGDEYNEVHFEVVPQFRCDLKGLTLCCVYSSDNPKPTDGLGIMVRNVTQGTTLHTWPAIASVKRDSKPEDYYLWQGQLSNDRLSLQDGDKVLLSVFATVDFVSVKKVGVNLEWYKVMKENMHDSDPHLYDLDPIPDWLSRTPDEAGARDWFGLVQQVGVDSTHMVEEMDEKEALELFSWHAFESDYPNQEYLDLSKRVIRYCQGFPLALKVSGSFLKKKTTTEWESHLEKLETSPPDGDIHKILRINFDSLPDSTREIFLDISCFFIEMDKDYVTQILYATTGINVLIERCLVTVSEQNKLMMHDLLRDMGRKIVDENARGDREKFSRLWECDEIMDVLRDESGTEEIGGVALDLHRDLRRNLTRDLNRFSAQAFTNMKKLRLLHLSRVELTGKYKDFPKTLIWLCWRYFPLESIPDDFPVQPKLVALDLQYSNLKIVWKDCKLHQNLKILNLSHSSRLTKSPDFSKLPNLEELILQFCWRLSEVHSSIGDLGKLSLVNLEGCSDLEDLPLNFYKSKSIETLLLSGCSSFEKLAEGLGDMVSLTTLKADETAIRQIPSLSRLSKLQDLSLYKCENLRAIPDLPTNLKVLRADGCIALEKMPDFSEMSNIRELYLSNWGKLAEIPGLDKSLDLQYSNLKIVRKDCKLHQNLKILNLSHSSRLTKSPDFSKLPNLEELILQSCWRLSKVHSSIGDLGRLSLVNLQGCKMLWDLPLNFYKSKSIKTLILDGCWSFKDLADGLGDMVSLTTLKADETAIRQIPSSILKLKKLKVLSLCNVKGLPSTNLLPPSLQSLSSLRELALEGWSLTDDAFPKDLGSLISLERLDLARNDVCSLPSLIRLSQLQDLSLHDCKNLHAIPDLPTNLEVLKANGCIALEKMPDFSEMPNIRELHLRDSGKLTEVPGLDKSLNSMTMIQMGNCTNLTADFRKNILQGWTSCGYGGICLSGNDIPDWFDYVHDDKIVFTVPPSVGRSLEGLTLSFVCSSNLGCCFYVIIKNMTQGTKLDARIIPCYVTYYDNVWQGQLSNDKLKLQDGDKVLIEIRTNAIKVKKTGVSLVWDKFMNENIIDYYPYEYERRPSQNLVNDDGITRRRVHLEWDKVMEENMDNPDPHLYDLETNGDFSGGVDDSISRNRENKGRKSKRRKIGSFDYV